MFDAADIAIFFDSGMPGYAEATLPGGAVVGGRFRTTYAEAFGLVGGNGLVFVAPSSGLATLSEGSAIIIGGVSYLVAEVQPGSHGTGTTLLKLETA